MRADVGSVLLGITITTLLVMWALGRGVLGGRLISMSEPLNDDEAEPVSEAEAAAHTQ
ncbi:MAG TPA: hypothetical protein VG650_04165 [Mycobacteriales bacterium]|nr:hypothetical protein [Mycobacteriales bacterium]